MTADNVIWTNDDGDTAMHFDPTTSYPASLSFDLAIDPICLTHADLIRLREAIDNALATLGERMMTNQTSRINDFGYEVNVFHALAGSWQDDIAMSIFSAPAGIVFEEHAGFYVDGDMLHVIKAKDKEKVTAFITKLNEEEA